MSDSPTNTYNSLTDLNLDQVPQVSDPETYRALLDIHNAIEILLTSSDTADTIPIDFVDKYRNNTSVSGDYTVLSTDGTIEVDASSSDVTITLPISATYEGYRYDIKVVAWNAPYLVSVVVEAGELIDGEATVNLDLYDNLLVKASSDTNGYNII